MAIEAILFGTTLQFFKSYKNEQFNWSNMKLKLSYYFESYNIELLIIFVILKDVYDYPKKEFVFYFIKI